MRVLRLIRPSRRGKTLLAFAGVIFTYTLATSIMQYDLALVAGAFAGSYAVFGFVMGVPWFFSLFTDLPIGGLILSAFVAPFVLLDYPVGRFLDRVERRFAAIVGGLLIGGVGLLLFSSVSHPLLLMVYAALVSLGFAFFYVAVNGIFDTISDHHRRGHMTGVWQAAEDAGFVVGPVAGGLATDVIGLRGSFAAFGMLFIISTFIAVVLRKDIQRYETKTA